MAQTLSQIQKIERFLKTATAKNGVTVSMIASKTKVPKGNILPHIAMLRKRNGETVVSTERRDLPNNGGRKVYFVPNFVE